MLNIVLPPKPEKPQNNVGNHQRPYNLISLLLPKIRYRSEMRQYEERLALLEKQWPGLKACKYDVDWYSRKCFRDYSHKFGMILFHLSCKCKEIKKLQDEIESYETKPNYNLPLISVAPGKDLPIKYPKELMPCLGGFEVFNDIYNSPKDASDEATELNNQKWTYGFMGKHFFVVSNLSYLELFEQGFPVGNNSNKIFYAVASCPSYYSDIVGILDKEKEIGTLEKRLQELKINKIMADNGFDENGRLLKKNN